MLIRTARPKDDKSLQRIDVVTWTVEVSPAPPPAPEASFFNSVLDSDVLVAEVGGVIAGYVEIGAVHKMASSSHVLEVKGLAVNPDRQRRGIGRLLIGAAVELAKERHARRLVLRVLSSNGSARALYEACGFGIEGILREQFFLNGRYVDDLFMAIDLRT